MISVNIANYFQCDSRQPGAFRPGSKDCEVGQPPATPTLVAEASSPRSGLSAL